MTAEKTPEKRFILMIAGPAVLLLLAGGWWPMGGRCDYRKRLSA